MKKIFFVQNVSPVTETRLTYLLPIFYFLFSPFAFASQNSLSDSVNVKHYGINLNIDFTNSQINGSCDVKIFSLVNGLNYLPLDLEQLNVDSVKYNGTNLVFSYATPRIHINLATAMNIGDSALISVFYHGHPVIDSSNWGGFYFNGNYAYNLGVGFQAHPQCFGRAWFPCVDNFVQHSAYTFNITVPTGKMAVCNGYLFSHNVNGNGTDTWIWQQDSVMVTYLACVAVADYTPANTFFVSTVTGDTIPVQLTARAADTTTMKNYLTNLHNAFNGFEQCWGPYRWNKIGYSFIPFSSGAMEHASNITIPLAWIAGGGLTYEQYAYHELAHHWFGDLVTCRTPQDMWLNEGWASYNQKIFYEKVYGRTRYDLEVASNHETVVHYNHVSDAGYKATSGVSHDFTYSNTVYLGGADVAHTLRGYMGDSLFFSCMKLYLDSFAHKNASSYDFRDFLSLHSGIDLTDFFNDWVFNAGFADFSIDSVASTPNGSLFDVQVFIKQKLSNATNYFQNVPLEISFYDANWDSTIQKVLVSGHCTEFDLQLPFNPVYTSINERNLISDATTDNLKHITAVGTNNFIDGKMNLVIPTLPDSALLRVTHHYAYADRMSPNINLHVSAERYWVVDGILPAGIVANATFLYNGQNSTNGGYLDNKLFQTSYTTTREDSLVLLYRSSPGQHWKIDTGATQNTFGNHNDFRGSFTTSLQKGQYTFGIWDHGKADTIILEPAACINSGVINNSFFFDQFSIAPNPSNDSFTIYYDMFFSGGTIKIMNEVGALIYSSKIGATIPWNGQKSTLINTHSWSKGIYFVCFLNENTSVMTTKKIVVQ